MWKTLPATFSLIGLNVVVYVLSHVLLPEENMVMKSLPLYFVENPDFGIWQFVSHMFMHGSISHLFLNMFGLFSFGSILERVWGLKRFLIFYFAAGIGAAMIYSAVNLAEVKSTSAVLTGNGLSEERLEQVMQNEDPQVFILSLFEYTDAKSEEESVDQLVKFYRTYYAPMVGASGAIYGILTAFGLLFPNAKLSLIFFPVPIAAKYFIPVLLLTDLFSGVTGISLFGGGIAHFAHVGGAIIGFLLMLLWKKDTPNLRAVQPMME